MESINVADTEIVHAFKRLAARLMKQKCERLFKVIDKLEELKIEYQKATEDLDAYASTFVGVTQNERVTKHRHTNRDEYIRACAILEEKPEEFNVTK